MFFTNILANMYISWFLCVSNCLLVIYLLLTMISVSSIVKHHQGPLRSFKNYEQTFTKN